MKSHLIPTWLGSFALMAACATAPDTRRERTSLDARAEATLAAMTDADPSLPRVLDRSAGYIVFPTVREGGFVGGGAAGVGVVYEDGRPIGYAELREGSVGAQIGGQSFSQLVVLESPNAIRRLTAGHNLDVTADASATAVTAGAAASASFEDGTAIFIQNESGLMVEASVGMQSITFVER